MQKWTPFDIKLDVISYTLGSKYEYKFLPLEIQINDANAMQKWAFRHKKVIEKWTKK